MSISGGIKLFDKSNNLGAEGATLLSSTGDVSSPYAIDRNPLTYWRSVGSDDLTTEILTLTFSEDKTINRILLLDHNWKQFTIKYDVSGTWTNFASVTGLDGSLSGITEATFADGTAYYEFSLVTTGMIQIQVLKTQVADAEKFISQIICTSELGTLVGYPEIADMPIDKNSRIQKMLSGKVLVQKSEESFGVKLAFNHYPTDSTYSSDLDLMFTLFDRDDNFIVWLCGGRRGSSYFRYQVRGFRLKDAITVQMTELINPKYSDNVYTNSINLDVTLKEAV